MELMTQPGCSEQGIGVERHYSPEPLQVQITQSGECEVDECSTRQEMVCSRCPKNIDEVTVKPLAKSRTCQSQIKTKLNTSMQVHAKS